LTDRNVNLSSTVETLNDEARFKDSLIQKLEDDMANLLNEYLDLQSRLQVSQVEQEMNNRKSEPKFMSKSSSFNLDNLIDLKQIKEERNELLKENKNLRKKLESIENEISYKYILKLDAEKKIIQIEQEKNSYMKRLSLAEVTLEKSRKELQELRIDTLELQKELDRSDKRLSGIYNSNNNNNVTVMTLENFLDDDDVGDEEQKESKKDIKPVPRNTLTRLKKSDLALILSPEQVDSNQYISTNYESEKKQQEYFNKSDKINEIIHENDEDVSKNSSSLSGGGKNNPLSRFMSKFDDEVECEASNKANNIQLTTRDIVKSISVKDFQTVAESHIPKATPSVNVENINITFNNSRPGSHNRFNTTKTANLTQDIYRDFFQLTYQSLKLNNSDIEPFLYLNVDKLYAFSNEKSIPYHKVTFLFKFSTMRLLNLRLRNVMIE
jgi:hypothetical protein